MDKRIVEEWLPLKEVNLDAKVETAFRIARNKYRNMFKELFSVEPVIFNVGTPQIPNIHLWLARRPCGIARSLTLASMLPVGLDRESFMEIVGIIGIKELAMGEKRRILPLLINSQPRHDLLDKVIRDVWRREAKDIVVLDPMAGGGSIPLEALRLGFRSIAIEYNPVAYIVLKATLEYPAKYGENLRLYEDVRKEAKALIEYAQKELSQYYAPDAFNYIIPRGFTCSNPECGGLIPVIHSTRLGRDGPYIKFSFDKKAKTFSVEIVDTETGFERLRCPYCGRPLTDDEVFREWIPRHRELLEKALSGDVGRVMESLDDLLRTHIPLVKQTRRGFVPCDDIDRQVFVKAYLDLAREAKELRNFVPDAPIPKENEVFEPVKQHGIMKWYELFNPRQLLVIAKLLKYVVEKAEKLIAEKGGYGAAVATYLALGLDKLADYNNIATMWHTLRSQINRLGDQYASKKSVGFGLEYCEAKRIDLALNWVYEPDVEKPTATRGGICPVVRELCGWLGGLGDRIAVYMGDARELTRITGEGRVSLVNVDPPYFDQHIYSDLFEYFWQFLRLSLKPAIDSGYLFNRDENKGRVECLVSGWSPMLPTMPRIGEIIVRKGRARLEQAYLPHTRGWYSEQMWRFFAEVKKALQDDGILLVWFTHSDPEAWESILGALYASDLPVSRVWTVATEAERFIGRISGFMFLTSMAIVARKSADRILVGESSLEALASNLQVREVVQKSTDEALQSARVSGASDRETYIMALAGAIAGATRIHNPSVEMLSERDASLNSFAEKPEELDRLRYRRVSSFFKDRLYPVAIYLGVNRILEGDCRSRASRGIPQGHRWRR
ncbi:MAG: hypothetical protein QXI39_06640 [Candidatus Bathyarchaeia archaeon]